MTSRNAAMGSVVTDAFGALFGSLAPGEIGADDLDDERDADPDMEPPGELPPARD
jgi:hypothetical protein